MCQIHNKINWKNDRTELLSSANIGQIVINLSELHLFLPCESIFISAEWLRINFLPAVKKFKSKNVTGKYMT